jgi:hypothetical protein
MNARTETGNRNYSFLDEAHLLDIDPKTLSLEALLQFKAALMHKLILVNLENQSRLKILAESTREMPASQSKITLGSEEADNMEKLVVKVRASGLTQDEILKIMAPLDSPEAIAKFVQDVEYTTWGDMVKADSTGRLLKAAEKYAALDYSIFFEDALARSSALHAFLMQEFERMIKS